MDKAVAEKILQEIGHDCFPDNTDVYWRLLGAIERGGFLCAEAEPLPPTVGYPRFRFVLSHENGTKVHACYCQEGSRWTLLFTGENSSAGWQNLQFDGPF